ncbi:MAG TPA: STAS domain-containing protein [Bacillus bacterium]|nr:STAS domain-containing protein [Bacillus sp. (in: firmicutes)]
MIFTSSKQAILLNWEEDVTLKNVASFRDAMKDLIHSDSGRLLLHLKGVQYLNSGALGVIADSVMTARKNQKELVVVATQQSVREIFNIVKFGTFIKIFDTKEEGLRYLKRDQDD